MMFAREQGFFDQLLIINIEHHATQAPPHSVVGDDEAASYPNPATPFRYPTDPVLNIEPAAGLDRALDSRFGAGAIFRLEQGEEKIVTDRDGFRDAKKPARWAGPEQFPGREIEIPDANSGFVDSALQFVVTEQTI
ncbi:hypothetical protein ACMYR2_pA0034 (plasmid) [Nitrobacter sp. TKz-YC01]